jgi:hypothetical protein
MPVLRSEASIQRSVLEYAKKKHKALCRKLSVQGPMGSSGWPDYMILDTNGYVFFIEFKRQGGKLTALQDAIRIEICARGFAYYLVDSVEAGKKVLDNELATW